MDIFNVHQKIVSEYSEYVQSFLNVADQEIKQFIQTEIIGNRTLWPHALLQLNPAYEKTDSVDQLVAQNVLHPECALIFRNKQNEPFSLYRHQTEAIRCARQDKPYIVTSGTGSGKTMTYFIPIFDAILRHNPTEHKVWAIIVYPMNALVNSQEKALTELAERYQANTGRQMPVRFGKYTGQESDAEKLRMRENPPHIILTNYVMLELMLVRPREGRFINQASTALRYLVLDELHTYRGRQGADVALLIRRLKERTGNPNLMTIGTSATMATGETRQQRRQAVADFATRLFGTAVAEENVIEETLQRSLPVEHNAPMSLAASLTHMPEATWTSFSQHPLSGWIENTFGLKEEEGFLRRQEPITLEQGAARLATETGIAAETCQEKLQQMLDIGSRTPSPHGGNVFAFKLHQFISQGGSIYATLEDKTKRQLTLEGQYFAPGEEDRLLYPLVFCRVCGQEYYTVRRAENGRFLYPDSMQMNDLLDEEETDISQKGYFMLDTNGRFQDEVEFLPDHWLNERGNLKKEYKPHRPVLLHVHSYGEIASLSEKEAQSGWFQPEPFMLCLNCGEAYTRRDQKDFRKLARLSSEGRSTATTLLSLTAVSAMRQTDLEPEAQKILSFTDNRQDASLQAGHFNDFVQVALIRTGLYQALRLQGQLEFEDIAKQVISTMGLTLDTVARQKGLDLASKQALETQAAFQELIEYRLYEDLRRGWRVVQPNLEQAGLLHVSYRGLPDLLQREDIWQTQPFMAQLSKEERLLILETILDEMRRQLAIDVSCLKRDKQDELRRRTNDYLEASWAIDESERLRYAGMFVRPGETRQPGDFSLSTRSVLGGWLGHQLRQFYGEKPDNKLVEKTMVGLLNALINFGILIEETEGKGMRQRTGIRLRASALIWQVGTGTPNQSPLRRYRAAGENYEDITHEANRYFYEFYRSPNTLRHLQRMEAAEHTAQIGSAKRIDREERFRAGALSTLFCSPTMELGVDIADLNAVHLRNIPPTPANYAQRSGRSGRAGQPALVLAYCSMGSGHDQYYFRNRGKMVAGVVVPPRIELNNEDLIRAHMHAIWLAKTGLKMQGSILDIVDLDQESYPLQTAVIAQITLDESRMTACRKECQRVLQACGLTSQNSDWLTDEWLDRLLSQAIFAFDHAFDRWRELFTLAWTQLLSAQMMKQKALLRRGKEAEEETRRANALEFEAQRQLDLLRCQNIRAEESDFYPYRYLASEGFLPGYNFPALPVRAYIAKSSRDGEYIARPRFLGLSEFGPNNVIYHDGAKYQVHRVMLPIQEPEKRFMRAKLCEVCGYLHEGEVAQLDMCEQCGAHIQVDNGRFLNSLLEMPTTGTLRRERITCDEEERLRRGFDITTHYRFARSQNQLRRTLAVTQNHNGDPLLKLTYAPAARLWCINHRWRRQVEDTGYRLNMKNGEWVKQTGLPAATDERTMEIKGNVRLIVHDTANALLLRPPVELSAEESFMSSLQYALVNAIQETYQIEESELASERIGTGDHRAVLIWEAAEGSLGILRHIIEKPDALAQLARVALHILHFDADGRDLRPAQDETHGCVHACYDCLLSYYNQMDHWRLNRHTVRDFLLELAQATTAVGSSEREHQSHYQMLLNQTDPESDLEREFLDYLLQTGRRLPDAAQRPLTDAYSVPDFFYEPNVCVFCDGLVHDQPQQQAHDQQIRQQLRSQGYRVIVYRYDSDLETLCRQYADVFGAGT